MEDHESADCSPEKWQEVLDNEALEYEKYTNDCKWYNRLKYFIQDIYFNWKYK